MRRIDQEAFIDLERSSDRDADSCDRSSRILRNAHQSLRMLHNTRKCFGKRLRGICRSLDALQDLPINISLDARRLGAPNIETQHSPRA